MNWIEIIRTIEIAKPREIMTSVNIKNVPTGESKRKLSKHISLHS